MKIQKNSVIIFTVLTLILFSIVLLPSRSYSIASQQIQQGVADTPPALVISVKEQSNSPLRISMVELTSPDPYNPEVSFIVENVTSKPISAYAIRHDNWFGASTSPTPGGVTLSNIASQDALLHPGQSKQEFIDSNIHSEGVKRIMMIVDFVEFIDGSKWGEDRYKSAEELKGFRVGAKMATDHLVEVFANGGTSAVLDAIKNSDVDIIIQENHSSQWIRGFKSGRGFLYERLRHLPQGRLVEIESEIRRPIDAMSQIRGGEIE